VIAGLDLEMPGPTQWRNVTLTNSVTANKLSEDDVNDRARNVLNLVKRAYKSGIGEDAKEGSRDTAEDRLILRKAAADSIVLMKNDENILPLAKTETVSRMHDWNVAC
jgi:beta-glucosidase